PGGNCGVAAVTIRRPRSATLGLPAGNESHTSQNIEGATVLVAPSMFSCLDERSGDDSDPALIHRDRGGRRSDPRYLMPVAVVAARQGMNLPAGVRDHDGRAREIELPRAFEEIGAANAVVDLGLGVR